MAAGARVRRSPALLEPLMFMRALWFLGTRHRCPCCGWRLRAFADGGASLGTLEKGFCPRCGSKARHRRFWLFLQTETDLFSTRTRLLEVSPKYAFARRWTRMRTIRFVGADLRVGPHIDLRMDLTAAPLRSDAFDAVICMHVLEEIDDDERAMAELARVVRPGGWAAISVPTRMDEPTYEDPSITSRKERKRAFGEEAHVRVYGGDLVGRLEGAGFRVRVDLAADVDPHERETYGLKTDENIFLCGKP